MANMIQNEVKILTDKKRFIKRFREIFQDIINVQDTTTFQGCYINSDDELACFHVMFTTEERVQVAYQTKWRVEPESISKLAKRLSQRIEHYYELDTLVRVTVIYNEEGEIIEKTEEDYSLNE